MRGRGWSLIRPLKRSTSDPFYAVAGNPPSITPPGPSLSKAAAQSNPHNDALLASPRGFFLRRLSDAGPPDASNTLMTGRHPKPFTKPVVPKIVFGPWVRAVPNVCLGDQRDARLFKIG
jgi:hypothetical protein